MISDIRELADGSTISADLCIVGGGAAAIAIALDLAGSKLEVCVLESGGLALEPEAQSLSGGESTGLPYFPLEESRYRMLGGSTFGWGARSAPLMEGDFAARPWVAHSGWPLSLEELQPFYERVESLAGLHVPFAYDERVWNGFATAPPEFDRDQVRFAAFQFGKILLFGEYYRSALRQARNVRVYLHANATGLGSNETASHIDHVAVRTSTGRSHRVRARAFVLACGGIENARLLLLSDSVNPKGLCNDRDLVGRYFMEHPTVPAGTIETDNRERLHDVFSPGLVAGRLVETGLALSPEVQREHACMNAVASTRLVATQDSTQALRELLWHVKHRKLPLQPQWYIRNTFIWPRMAKIVRNPLGIVVNVGRHLLGRPKRFDAESMYLEVRSEQEPNPESRVTLAEGLDALGQRRVSLHWSLTERDKRTMRVAAETFDAEIRRLGLGHLRLADWLRSDALEWSPEMVGGHHHMGTTRMSESEATGIVDRDGRAHSIDNLFVAGSSVFPTCGVVNPTQTILALAVRLAGRLRMALE